MWLFDWQVRNLAPAPDLSLGQFRQNEKKTHTEKKSCRLWLLLLLLCLFFLLCLLCLRPRFLREFIFIFCTHCSCPLARTHTHTRLGQLHLALLAASNQVQGRATRTARIGGRSAEGEGGQLEECDEGSWRCRDALRDCNQRCQLRLVGPQVESSRVGSGRVSTLLAASTNWKPMADSRCRSSLYAVAAAAAADVAASNKWEREREQSSADPCYRVRSKREREREGDATLRCSSLVTPAYHIWYDLIWSELICSDC